MSGENVLWILTVSHICFLHSHVAQLTADWAIQSHRCTEPSEAEDRSVRGRSGCQRWEVTRTASPGCDETQWPRCTNRGGTFWSSIDQEDVS